MAILFDFGGTLDADGMRWSVRFHAAYRDAGGGLPFDRFEPLFQESDRQLARAPGIHRVGFLSTLEMQSTCMADLLASVGERIAPDALAGPVHRSALAVIGRNRTLLASLAEDHRLGVVSNFTGNLRICLAEVDLLSPFDFVIDSANVGISKPDPRIFQLALSLAASRPAETWMVGDNPHADLVPTARLGLKTCWLAPADDHRQLPAGLPTARIATLLELGNVLDTPCTV